ncbi:hypothetical protein SAMN05444422_10524 [Halobiforma haloterrestris]|uniref:PQQ-like domain-containing protein n=1 Tax=Natronobacterium haloterrestre TaxID=148448 RepID=A0A1I1H1M5_NATHA|nr:hypothetical protein [Halobiforma haloterrestris]SFC15070.1 hypothetical protein SAMN05444422_10524 [Halobiforma haloterrestris]
MADSYRQVGSFESGRVDAVGVGRGAIAVGIGTRVEVVEGSRSTAIDHGDRIDDVAVADRVVVLSSGDLTTYSRDGDRLWSQGVGDAHAIAAVPDAGICGVLGPNRLRAIEIATGREQFDADRTRPGGRDDELLAVPTGFLIATWSFLTHVDLEGEVDFDRDLSAVIRSVGRCDDVIVAALQSDQLVGLQAGTGELRWRTELEATHVAPVGEGSVLVGTAAGTRAVGADGATEPVGDLPNGAPYATPDGGIVCSVREGTVSTHVHAGDQLALAVATDSVGVGGTIAVEVTNQTDRERTASIAVDVTGCSLSPSDRTVTVDPGGTEIVDFPVSSVRAEGEADLAIAVDGSVAHEASITVEDAASGGIAVETALETRTIEDGVAELEVAVENVGGVSLDSVTLLETEAGTGELPAGETWTGSVTRPYEPERRVSVGLEVARGDRRREYAPTCTLPSAPTIDLESGRDALRATVGLEGDVTLSDRLVIEMPGAGRVRSPVTIDGDELLLVVPQYEEGTARIGFDALGIDERIRLSDSGPFSTPSRSSSRSVSGAGSQSRSSSESQSRSRSRSRSRSGTDSGTQSRSDSRPRSETTDDSARTEPSETGSRTRDEHTGSPADDGSIPAADDDDRSASDTTGSPTLAATRRVPDAEPAIGHAVRDRIVLRNDGDGPAEDVVVAVGDDRRRVGTVPAGETVPLERAVGVVSPDGVVLPSVEIEVGDVVVDRLPDRRLEASVGGIAVKAAVDPDDGTVAADLVNRDDRDCRVLGLELADAARPESLGERLEAGETTTVTASVSPDGQLAALGEGGAAPLSIAVRYADGEEETIDALATVASLEGAAGGAAAGGESGDDLPDERPLAVEIGPETQAAGEYGSVVLVFENESDRALSDVSVSAGGDPINEMFYSEARRERLAAGDWIEHFVDLEAGIEEPTFEAVVSYAVDGAEREYTVRASGPAVADEDAWTDDHLEAWSVERLENTESSTPDSGGTPSVPELPSSLSTPLRRDT